MRYQSDLGTSAIPPPDVAPKVAALCHFSSLATDVPRDEVFDLLGAFALDKTPNKVNLGAGVYRTEEGHPWPLPVVQKVEEAQYQAQDITRHEYLPIAGDIKFTQLAAELVFKTQSEAKRLRIASVQTVSGTGANHVGAMFLAHTLKPKHVWISDPTWANHHSIWQLAEVERREYPYYNSADCTFDFDGMMRTLDQHAEPNDEQWIQIADLCRRKQLFPFFDCAYQGFASGDLDQDAWAIRHFFRSEPALEMCVAQSFSKSLGLYGQRTGAFHLVSRQGSPELRTSMIAHLSHLVRSEISMAPKYGAVVARTILESPELMQDWLVDLKTMSHRIKSCRQQLYQHLVELGTPGTWNHIVDQNGMFSYTGLTPEQVEYLLRERHIYMLRSGRISISGLNTSNVRYVAESMDAAVRNLPSRSH